MAQHKMNIKIKRVYDDPAEEDGVRILVDRLWPRGLAKEKARIDIWLKDIAPSTELRKWFDHDPAKWNEFRQRYEEELRKDDKPALILKEHLKKGVVTLVYGAKDEDHNNAVVIKEFMSLEMMKI
jgi:uncharacterized protein YeaO (DUF488 family)